MSDVDAIQAVKNGDKDRYAELVQRHQRMVYAIVWSRLGDRDLCEDAAQETFVKAYRYLMALRNPAKFPGWLARIAQNVSTSMLRTRKRELDKRERWKLEPHATSTPVPDALEEISIGETLRATLAELPVQHRECLALYYLEGKSVRDAAEILSISEANLKTRLHRARQALRGRLEQKLEDSLAEMGPRKEFSAGVIALLPATPWAAGIGGVSLGSKVFASLSQTVFLPVVLFTAVFNGAFMAVFFGWLAKLETTNLVPGPLRKARTRVIRASTIYMLGSGIVAILLSFALMSHGSPMLVYQLLVPYCAWLTYRMGRALRVNRSPFIFGQLLFLVMLLVVSILIGFFHAPFWIFFAAMLPLNIILYFTNKSRPARHDYNLFLREANGLLGTANEEVTPNRSFTTTELRAFARFLGERFLIKDYKLRDEGILFYLPPVKPGAGQYLGLLDSNSTIRIGSDGLTDAHLGLKDQKDIKAVSEAMLMSPDELEERVAAVVSGAIRLFLQNRAPEAELLLQSERDSEIFTKPIGNASEHRVRGIAAIIAAIFLLAFSLSAAFFWTLPPPVRMSQDVVNEAIVAWDKDPVRYQVQFMRVLEADAHIPLNWLNVPARNAYKSAALDFLTRDDGGDLTRRINYSLSSADKLHNIITCEILSDPELAAIGITRDSVRDALTRANRDMLPNMTQLWHDNEDSIIYPGQVVSIARLVACLKYFGCLDLLDTDRVARDIADQQVTAAWESREGETNWKRARGLFSFKICDFEGTYGALCVLQELDRLDLIDRKACIEGILRFYEGRGRFGSPWERRSSNIQIHGNNHDTLHALESLLILNALDRIPDFNRWNLKPELIVTDRDKPNAENIHMPDAIIAWSYQKRLELVRATYDLPERTWSSLSPR
jgi:RNA polymerase sigma-70 factor (ECF subfamily)